MDLLKRFWLLLVIIVLLALFFSFDLQRFLSFEALNQYHQQWSDWTADNFWQAIGLFCLIYVSAVATSFPGAVFLTLLGGLLFGLVWGTVVVVISATIGASILYLAVKTALGDWLANKAGRFVNTMRDGFRENAFSYLLTLRFIPIFPFWVVNIVPAVLGVPFRTYFLATLLGIIPGSFIFVSIGNSLSHLFARGEKPDLSIIFSPPIILPLVGLALISLIPVGYKHFKGKRS